MEKALDRASNRARSETAHTIHDDDRTILTTRLYAPPVRSKLVSRSRLSERLNEGLDRKLTLISDSRDKPSAEASLLPLVAGLADYVENVSIIVLLLRYPTQLNNVTVVANALTVTKGFLIVVSTFLLAAGPLGLLIKAVVTRAGRKATTNISQGD